MDPFFLRHKDEFHPTASSRGPWDERFQHGGPPSALLLHEMARTMSANEGFVVVRFTAEFLKPVPIAPLRVEVSEPTGGRRVKRVYAKLIADTTVMEASAVFVAQTPDLVCTTVVREGHHDAEWPTPESLESFAFPFFVSEVAYHRAIDVRMADTPWGDTPVRCWARPMVALLDDQNASPEEAVVVLADAESGMGPSGGPAEVQLPQSGSHRVLWPTTNAGMGRPRHPFSRGWRGCRALRKCPS